MSAAPCRLLHLSPTLRRWTIPAQARGRAARRGRHPSFLPEIPTGPIPRTRRRRGCPGEPSKALLSDTLKTSKWRSMIAANLLLHYPKAADTFGGLDANVRSRALGHLSAILALNGLYDADALAVACPARGRAGCVRLQHHGRRASFDARARLTIELIAKSVDEGCPTSSTTCRTPAPGRDRALHGLRGPARDMATHWRDSGLQGARRS